MWSEEYQSINNRIDAQNSLIERNEKSQSYYMASHGQENSDLLERHDVLVDELQVLLAERHVISSKEFA